jgi:hypothetical protein
LLLGADSDTTKTAFVPAGGSDAVTSFAEIAGGASSSRIVPTAWPSSTTALLTFDRVRVNVSAGSSLRVSLTAVTTIGLLVSPGANVTTPAAAA